MRRFLLDHAAKDPVSFHMPGHKGSDIFRRYGYGDFLDHIADCDITEIPGADNLFQAEDIIMRTQEKYASLYGADHSYLLINGTSGGLIASILASVKPGGKLIMARNCHKSVFNAAALGQITPVYAHPDLLQKLGITGAVQPEEIRRCLDEAPDAEAVILPSPNYYGICSDIEKIAAIVHEAGKILIVDQAHGAHLKFFHKFGYGDGMPLAAEDAGADLVVGSIHKTLASFTQSAVLNLCSRRVDRYVLEDKLQTIQSTSPSYILMGSLDLNADLLLEHGPEAIGQWRENVDWFYREAARIDGLSLLDTPGLDRTKINIDMSQHGISGAALEKLLMDDEIYSELYTGNLLMFMTGIGNTRAHMERAVAALRKIASAGQPEKVNTMNPDGIDAESLPAPSPGALHSVPGSREFVPLQQAAGRICAGSIIPYPPGIPLVCPGEEITEEVISWISQLRSEGEKVIGVNDRGEVLVGI